MLASLVTTRITSVEAAVEKLKEGIDLVTKISRIFINLCRKERGLSSNFNLQRLQNSVRFEILPYVEVVWNVFALLKLIACIDMSNQFAKLKHLRYHGHSPLWNVLLISLISLSEEGLYIILYQCDESKNILTQLEESWHQYNMILLQEHQKSLSNRDISFTCTRICWWFSFKNLC